MRFRYFYYLLSFFLACFGIAQAEQLQELFIREFNEFSEEGYLVKVIVDDGQGAESDDLDHVTQRFIQNITPMYEGLAAGKPHLIEEKVLFPAIGKEISLKTIVITYSEQGEVVRRDIFDSQGRCWSVEYSKDGPKLMRSGECFEIVDSGLSIYPVLDTLKDAASKIVEVHSYIQRQLERMWNLQLEFEEIGHELLGKAFFFFTGYYSDVTEQGVIGNGEANDKIRITHINGILNSRTDTLSTSRLLSRFHGGVNVHYTYRASQGWTTDALKCCIIKAGYTSIEARKLAANWRKLIQEMGGIEGKGRIIHYAHSIGGTETLAAKNLLTSEEQRMITVVTLGSATVLPNKDFESVVNYVSRRDLVTIFADPIGYFRGAFSSNGNVVLVGETVDFPLIDHLVAGETYTKVIESLGKKFILDYGVINAENFILPSRG